MGKFEELLDEFNRQPYYEQLKLVRSITATNNLVQVGVSSLSWDGCLRREEDFAIRVGDEEYSVYLWKHAWGEPFYVGSGKGDRWKILSPRCDDFYRQIDAADAVVYRLIVGATSDFARRYEKYLTFCLRLAGYSLVNGDYFVPIEDCTKTDEAKKFVLGMDKEKTTLVVKKMLSTVLGHTPRGCDYRITCKFIEEYGSDYFSRNHIKPKISAEHKTEERSNVAVFC